MKIRNWKQSFACFQFPSQIEFWKQFLFSVRFELPNKFFSLKNRKLFLKTENKGKKQLQTYPKSNQLKKKAKNVWEKSLKKGDLDKNKLIFYIKTSFNILIIFFFLKIRIKLKFWQLKGNSILYMPEIA